MHVKVECLIVSLRPEASNRQSGEIFEGEAKNKDSSAYLSLVILAAPQRSVLIERKALSEVEEKELASLASI